MNIAENENSSGEIISFPSISLSSEHSDKIREKLLGNSNLTKDGLLKVLVANASYLSDLISGVDPVTVHSDGTTSNLGLRNLFFENIEATIARTFDNFKNGYFTIVTTPQLFLVDNSAKSLLSVTSSITLPPLQLKFRDRSLNPYSIIIAIDKSLESPTDQLFLDSMKLSLLKATIFYEFERTRRNIPKPSTQGEFNFFFKHLVLPQINRHNVL